MVSTVNIGNIEMDYCRFGNGKRIFVIIPGLSLVPVTPSEEAVAGYYSSLTDEFTIYMFDRRKNVPVGYSIENMADDTAAVMKDLGIKKACLFGASQGGMIVLSIAVNHPELVEKAVVGSASSRPSGRRSVIEDWVDIAADRNKDKLVSSMLDTIYSENTLGKYRDTMISAYDSIPDIDYEQFSIIAKPITSFNIYDRLTEISCPLLVMGCDGDRVFSGDDSRDIAEKTGCQLIMYGREYGHAVYDEAPDYVSNIKNFLQ